MSSTIDITLKSLFLDTKRWDRNTDTEISIGTATVFLVEAATGPVLITNRHIVTGRDSQNRSIYKHGGIPDQISIRHNRRSFEGGFIQKSENIYDANGSPLWFEHPHLGKDFDVIALPLTETMHVRRSFHELSADTRISVGLTDPVSVIGFPFGNSGPNQTALWATGPVASEIDINDEAFFWIDCRTRPGQSGSPVVAFRNGNFRSNSAAINIGTACRFLGVYGSRMHEDSDLGKVWRAELVTKLIQSIEYSKPSISVNLDE